MDEERKRLRRLRFATFFACLAFIIAFAFYVSYQFRYFNSQLGGLASQIQNADKQKGPIGKTGMPGPRGEVGLRGLPGLNSTSTNTILQQPTYTNVPVDGPKGGVGDVGPQGEKGDPGTPGKVIFIRENPETKELECKWSGDTFWYALSECQ